MLRKLLITCLLTLGLAATGAAQTASGTKPADSQVQQGMWPDGTVLLWKCEIGMEGKIRLMVILPNGTQYPTEVECLPRGQKKT